MRDVFNDYEPLPATFSFHIVPVFPEVRGNFIWRAGHDCFYPQNGCGAEELA